MAGKRGSVALLVMGVLGGAACYHVNSTVLDTPAPPADLYRCLQLELGREGYAIVGADRASGWLHAQRRIERVWEVVTAEVYATVIPDEADGSHLQLTDNNWAEEDMDRIVQRCAPNSVAGAAGSGGEQ